MALVEEDAQLKLQRELNEERALRERLSTILDGVAIALKGPADELTMHSWSDLPEIAKKARDAVESLRDHLRTASQYLTTANDIIVKDACGDEEDFDDASDLIGNCERAIAETDPTQWVDQS